MDRRGSRLSRRQFVAGAAGAGLMAGCGRLPGQAEQPAKVHRIGLLSPSASSSSDARAFLQGMQDWGYVEGENLALEWRRTTGETEALAELAAELARLPVDVIVTTSTPPTQAAMASTSAIPIVFVGVGDPVGSGLVTSLARPNTNATGLSQMSVGMAPKRLELLKATIPDIAIVGVLWNAANPTNNLGWLELQGAASMLGVQLLSLEVRSTSDIAPALDVAARERVNALMVPPDILTSTMQAPQILQFTAAHGLPSMFTFRQDVEAGALMSYGPSLSVMYRRAAYYVDRILKGAKPADLPVEQPMTFDFVVNMKTARELGITFPNEIMLQVTETIER